MFVQIEIALTHQDHLKIIFVVDTMKDVGVQNGEITCIVFHIDPTEEEMT